MTMSKSLAGIGIGCWGRYRALRFSTFHSYRVNPIHNNPRRQAIIFVVIQDALLDG